VAEDRIEADLALGRHARVVRELETIVGAQPLRERPYEQLMIALYRCGRQADALAVYQKARRTLVDELGIEPGQPLQQLERAILQQDPSLELPAPDAAGPALAAWPGTARAWLTGTSGRRRLLATATALAIMLALLVAATTHRSAHLTARPDSVAVIDGARDDLSAVVTGVGRPNGIASGAGALWVTDSADDLLLQVDPAGQVIDRIPVGRGPAGVTVGDGEVWVANELDGTVSEVNPGAGRQVAAIPVPTDGGKTYTFRLRRGIRYSSGALVRPEDFRRAIERVFMINKQGNPGIPSFYAGIASAAQCERNPGRCDLAHGIVADDAAGTITFHLTAPDPEFLYKLAFSWAYPIPRGTPDRLISAAQLPATGPYMTKSLIPGRTWVLVRNPRFRQWSPQAQPRGYPDRIILRLDVPPGQAVADVEHGQADVLLSPPPAGVDQLATRYTSQLHSGPMGATIALALNTRVAPFDQLAARQAVNDAINRNTVVALNGGPLTVQPTCQVLPPTMPGYRPYCPYTILPGPGGAWTAPDLALARRLVGESRTQGDHVRVLYSDESSFFPSLATARYLVSVLGQLGYRASLQTTSADAYWGMFGDSRNRVQAGFFSWQQDYPAPPDFIDPLFTCGSFLPLNQNNLNEAEFCNPRIDAQAQRALTSQPGDPTAAAARWAAIDHELTDQAPWVPLYNPLDLTVLSARVGNYQFHAYWNVLIDQLWVR
jgi:peptide/nickel transport system substrate-binding protein